MIKIILFIFLICSTANAQQDLQKIRISDFSGGMVSNSLADVLSPNQSASMLNVEVTKKGQIIKRKGQALFASDVGVSPFTGIGRFDPDQNTSYMMAASGVYIVRAISNASDWTVVNQASSLTTGLNTEFIQANDLLFVLNGYDNTAWYNGSAWNSGGTWPASPPTATTGTWFRNYLFLAGNTTERDWIYISNNLEPTVYTATDLIKVNTGDGQKIQRIVPFRLNELIVYKERSIFLLDITGVPPSTCTIDDCWTLQPLSNVYGTIAPRSVVSLGNDQWYLSSEPIAIRSLVRTSLDKILVEMVSEPIQDLFDRTGTYKINKTYISNAAAVYYKNKYLLAVPEGTSIVNNFVVVYDFPTKSWSYITGWYPSNWVVFDDRLFYTDANDGRIVECFTGNIGDWGKGPSFVDWASAPTIGIDFDYISRSIDFENPENYKELDSIEVEFEPTGNFEAVVYTNLDGNGWASIGSVNLNTTSSLPITLPSTLGNANLVRKTFQLSDKGEYKKLQVRVKQSGVNEQTILQRITVFSRVKQWRRE